MTINLEFKIEGNWILPTKGTFGNKARNLYDNQGVIANHGFKIPRSMVIPYEYLAYGYPAIVDIIHHYFGNGKTVAIRSNSPDEDLGERTPGLYRSEAVELNKDRVGTQDIIGAVVDSYNYYDADFRRKELRLENKGMCLLVQDFIPADYSGSFSDLGETGILTFTNSQMGMRAMTEKPFSKYRVDLKGKIISKNLMHTHTYEEYIAERLRRLSSALPKLGNDKGWETEFVFNEEGKYIVQTTPIKRQASFVVVPSERNIFDPREVIGRGSFRTNGILYLPFSKPRLVSRVDDSMENYCIVTNYHGVSRGVGEGSLERARKSNVLICIEDRFPGLHPFSAHVAQFIREGDRCAMVGRFTNDMNKYLLSSDDISLSDQHMYGLFSPTQLDIQADESLNLVNIEIIGEAKPFERIE